MRRIVDLPHPDGPSSAVNDPAAVSNVTSSRACTVERPTANDFVRPLTAMPDCPVIPPRPGRAGG